MKRRRAAAVKLVAVALAAGCGKHEFEPPPREAQVAAADSIYSTVLFDTIAWDSAGARELEGNAVFAAECRKCHGPLGHGVTEYARQRGLDVPSLVEPGWKYAQRIDSVRHTIFVGHTAGMPTWGVAGISPREIDAVAYYVLYRLRPDVLGGDTAGAPDR